MAVKFFDMLFSGDVHEDYPHYSTASPLIFADGDGRSTMVFNARQLAASAVDSFSGVHASQWPFFPCLRGDYLPWNVEYWRDDDTMPLLRRNAIYSEAEEIAEKLLDAIGPDAKLDDFSETFGAVWLSRELMTTKKGAVQGLAVQVASASR